MIKKALLALLAIFLLFEEWLWDSLTVLGGKLVHWLNLAAVEQWLMQASPHQALAAFCLPLLMVTPINLIAFWLLAHGAIIEGLLLEVLAKLLGTVLIARVFALTKPQLLTFRPLLWLYTTIHHWLQWAHGKITGTPFYQWAKHWQQQAKARWLAWFS